MKHKNISIFIPHLGCKHQCSFCNQNTISSTNKAPTVEEVDDILKEQFNSMKDKTNTEIAFFGGSFTAINKSYMIDLLETANKYIGENKFSGIRISTRPDCINKEILDLLKKYNVTAIELGAQSMNDEVLTANNRGHLSQDVVDASILIKEYNIELGLQMMVGLHKDTEKSIYYTAEKIAEIKPKTVRIYPTVILKDTVLAELYQQGIYKIMPLDEAVDICADLLEFFENNEIKVIKLGLHSSVDVEENMVAGLYHPAFSELCQSRIYYRNALKLLEEQVENEVILQVNPSEISKMIGQGKENIKKFEKLGYKIKVEPLNDVKKFEILVKKDVQTCY